jgi:hypothetical protein
MQKALPAEKQKGPANAGPFVVTGGKLDQGYFVRV